MAVLGLEKTLYQAIEDTDVTVCVTAYTPAIDCPIESSFNVCLSTSDYTAGAYLPHTVGVHGT